MVVVPGTEGNFGVLPGHAPLISTIRPGTVDIYQGGAITERIFVVGGIAEVTPERCTVLADEAMSPDSLDRAGLDAELTEIEGNLPSLRDQLGRATGTDRLEGGGFGSRLKARPAVPGLTIGHPEIIVVLSGIDERSGQGIHGRWGYQPKDIRWNAHFVDILGKLSDGTRTVDYRRFNDVIADEESTARIVVR